MPSSQALTTAPARCTTCAPTRRCWTTRTPAWTPASRLWPCPTRAALSLLVMMTSTATSGTHWRGRKSVSGVRCIQCLQMQGFHPLSKLFFSSLSFLICSFFPYLMISSLFQVIYYCLFFPFFDVVTIFSIPYHVFLALLFLHTFFI